MFSQPYAHICQQRQTLFLTDEIYRVPLKSTSASETDYINASFINVSSNIATQILIHICS